MVMPLTRRWTVDDVRAIADAAQDGTRYELIDGVLLVTPAPRWAHQFVVRELVHVLHPHVTQAAIGQLLIAPADIDLAPASITQPDLFVVPPANVAVASGVDVLLAVEVISPASARTDRGIKREFYLTHGVAEYWVVDADARTVECHWPTAAAPTVHRDHLVWRHVDAAPLTIDLVALFGRVDDAVQATAWRERT